MNEIRELLAPRITEHYGENPLQAVTERIDAELEMIEAHEGWAEQLLRACKIVQRLRADGALWCLPGINGGFLLTAFLLGITQVNPLKPHYLCPACKHFEFSGEAEDGFDLPARVCPHCGAAMEGDGHGLALGDCAAFLAGRRHELFTEWRVSKGGKVPVYEVLSQCGPVTPFFAVEFEDGPEYSSDPYEESEGSRPEIIGWVLSLSLPVPKWRKVEFPEGSGQFVQAFFREGELCGPLPGAYTVFEAGNLKLLDLLCRETKLPPDSIPCRTGAGFSEAAKAESARYHQPDSPSAKATGLSKTIRSRQLTWFEQEYPREYRELSK